MNLQILIDAFWFFLPAGIANMSPVLVNRLPILRDWKTPIDLGKKVDGHRVLGDNKTWRGLAFGSFMGGVTGGLVYLVRHDGDWIVLAILIGAAMGLGALVGDAVESFFKRRRGIKPGNAWFPFDQIDYIIGGLIFVAPVGLLTPDLVAGVFLLYFVLHLVTSYVGYLVGLKDKPI